MELVFQEALDLIANDNKSNDFDPHATLISLIRNISSHSWVASFNHTLREENEYDLYQKNK
jgi:hypothetical protein